MNELVERINKFIADIRTKANASLTQVGPLDQIEAGQEILSAVRALKWTAEEAQELGDRIASIESELANHVQSQISSQVEAGELVPKEDYENKINAAKEETKQEIESAKNGEIAALKRMEANRRLVNEELPASVAAAVSDEILQMEDPAPAIGEIKRRTEALAKVGLKADDTDETRKKTLVRKVFCAALDEDGGQAFDAEVSDLVALGLKPGDPANAPGSVRASQSSQPPVTHGEQTPQKSERPGFAF